MVAPNVVKKYNYPLERTNLTVGTAFARSASHNLSALAFAIHL